MLGFIVFAAVLHIALGYGLAVYLGYAPVVSEGTGGSTTQFASLISDDDIVIAGDDPIAESNDLPTIAEVELASDETAPETTELDINMQPPVGNASSEDAISTAVDELSGVWVRVHELLVGCADEFSGSNDEEGAAFPGPASAVAFTSGAIGQELGMINSLAPEIDDPLGLQVSAASERFFRDMTKYMVSTDAISAGSSSDAQSDRVHWISAVEATYKLRDALSNIQFELAQRESWISHVDEPTLVDEETDLPTATGIAKEYGGIQESRTEASNLVVALLDIDNCRKLNSSLGPIACNELIVHVAELVRSTLGDVGQVGRLSGQRFVALLPGFLPNAATDEIERVRETLGAVTFRVDGVDHRASLTCGLAEADLNETASDLMNRLEDTLAEAKRYGKDRTFLHEGEFPAPVIPSKLNVDSQVIEMTSATSTVGAVSEANL